MPAHVSAGEPFAAGQFGLRFRESFANLRRLALGKSGGKHLRNAGLNFHPVFAGHRGDGLEDFLGGHGQGALPYSSDGLKAKSTSAGTLPGGQPVSLSPATTHGAARNRRDPSAGSGRVALTASDAPTQGEEVAYYQSNPNVLDTDGDGFGDGFEVMTGFSPTSAASTPDALSTALPAIEYRFNAANGISYRIEASTDLANWQTIETNIPGTGGVVTRFYSIEGQTRRYFRSRRN